MRHDFQIMLKISIAAFIISVIFAFVLRNSWDPNTEGVQFDAIGWNITSGHGFSLSDRAPYIPTMGRDPAYPFFLSVIYRFFGHNVIVVVLVQIALFVLTCLLSYALAQDIFGKKVATYSGMLCAISPALANYPSYLLSETLFIFLICLTVFCLNRAVSSKGFFWFLASGVSLGITVLCKSIIVLFFFLAFAGIILLKPSDSRILSRKFIGRMIIFSLIFLLLAGSWSRRNYSEFGTYQISLRGSAALWERAERLEKPWKDMKCEIMYNFSEYLGNKIFPGMAENPRDVLLEWSRKSYYKSAELEQAGLSPLEADRAMRKEAVEKIRANPIKFIAYMPMELIKMTAFVYVPMLNEPQVINWFHGLRHGNAILSSIRGAFRLCAYPILVFAVIGIISTWHLWRKWFFLIAVIIYINLIYSMLFAMGRYAVPLAPFYAIFASAGFLELVNRRGKIS